MAELKDKHLSPDRVTEEDIHRHLYTAHMPDPDLLIRTSGEQRISNFLLWQIAYTEIFVTERYWPDFRGIHLLEAIADFQRRERRYGGIGEDGGEVEENPDQIRIAVSKPPFGISDLLFRTNQNPKRWRNPARKSSVTGAFRPAGVFSTLNETHYHRSRSDSDCSCSGVSRSAMAMAVLAGRGGGCGAGRVGIHGLESALRCEPAAHCHHGGAAGAVRGEL
jgi:hypothetical protein